MIIKAGVVELFGHLAAMRDKSSQKWLFKCDYKLGFAEPIQLIDATLVQ